MSKAFQTSIKGRDAGDWEALASALRAVGLQEEDVAELRCAADADLASGETGFGPEARAWLAGMKVSAAHGLAAVESHVVSGVITTLLVEHFGH